MEDIRWVFTSELAEYEHPEQGRYKNPPPTKPQWLTNSGQGHYHEL